MIATSKAISSAVRPDLDVSLKIKSRQLQQLMDHCASIELLKMENLSADFVKTKAHFLLVGGNGLLPTCGICGGAVAQITDHDADHPVQMPRKAPLSEGLSQAWGQFGTNQISTHGCALSPPFAAGRPDPVKGK